MASNASVTAIIGGGKMGADIAAVLAAGGWEVHLQEPAARMRESLPKRFRAALKYLRGSRASASRLRVYEDLEALPWSRVALVIEAAPEDLTLKQDLFKRLEALAPRRAILTTNTSSLPLERVMAKVKTKDRVAILHWATPAYMAPLVEIVRGKHTAAATIARINAWMRALGKLPVNLNRDVDGMIINRVQHAMMREALSLVDRGIASLEDIDLAVRYGFGFRYVVTGPVRQRDLNGLVINHRAARQIYPTLDNRRTPPRALSSRVRSGHVGVTVGRGFYTWDARKLRGYVKRYEATLERVLRLMQAFDRAKP
jgi:3-hydroxybutyryl-CoA dehydrogenase